jgi:hypothetical protein
MLAKASATTGNMEKENLGLGRQRMNENSMSGMLEN